MLSTYPSRDTVCGVSRAAFVCPCESLNGLVMVLRRGSRMPDDKTRHKHMVVKIQNKVINFSNLLPINTIGKHFTLFILILHIYALHVVRGAASNPGNV